MGEVLENGTNTPERSNTARSVSRKPQVDGKETNGEDMLCDNTPTDCFDEDIEKCKEVCIPNITNSSMQYETISQFTQTEHKKAKRSKNGKINIWLFIMGLQYLIYQ